MALAFVNSRDFVTSNIIGATNIDQLKENVDSFEIALDDDLISEIEKINQENFILVPNFFFNPFSVDKVVRIIIKRPKS